MKRGEHGEVIVYRGPMYGNKTSKLFAEIEPQLYVPNGGKVLVFRVEGKYRSDDVNVFILNSGVRIDCRDRGIEARAITHSSEILPIVEKLGAKTISFDETQFLDLGVAQATLQLYQAGLKVVHACLNVDWQGKAFESITKIFEMVPEAKIYRCPATCIVCGIKGHRTQRLLYGVPVYLDIPLPRVQLGRTESYCSVCERCFRQTTPTNKEEFIKLLPLNKVGEFESFLTRLSSTVA